MSIAFVLVPIFIDIVFVLLFAGTLFLPFGAFLFPAFLSFVHILHSQFDLHAFNLDGHTHDLTHLLLSQLLLMHLELIQPVIVGREVHELVLDCKGRVLGESECLLHLPLPTVVLLHIVDLPDAVLEDVIAQRGGRGRCFLVMRGSFAFGLLQAV